MKSKYLFLTLLLASSAQAQIITECTSSDSDVDGDGYGWENGASCMVGVSPPSNATCVDSPPVGDGWGWDGNKSCRISNTTEQPSTTPTTLPACLFPGVSDPDGDGYGYENGSSCVVGTTTTSSDPFAQILDGTWQCTQRYPHVDPNIQHGGGVHFPTITAWRFNPQVVCGSKCAGNYAGTKTMTFSNDQVAIDTVDNNGHWKGVETVPWTVVNLQMNIGDLAVQKFAFEQYGGNEYFHYYINDSSRWTCKRQ